MEQVKNALSRLGFSLTLTEGDPAIPDNISEPLREYIWRPADFRAMRK